MAAPKLTKIGRELRRKYGLVWEGNNGYSIIDSEGRRHSIRKEKSKWYDYCNGLSDKKWSEFSYALVGRYATLTECVESIVGVSNGA